jgi:cytochrome c oxidase subunit 3
MAELVAHQFEEYEQQHEAATLGMWVFISTEVLFFGAMLLGYTVYRHYYFDSFKLGSEHLLMWAGMTNTAVLLTSSLTVALAVRFARLRRRGATLICLLITIALGLAFISIKGFEYHTEAIEHLVPGLDFYMPEAAQPANVALFFVFYFFMTLLHAVHMTIGVGLMTFLAIQVSRGRYVYDNPDTVEIVGLYWHFVDLVWIFLYPLLYLVR